MAALNEVNFATGAAKKRIFKSYNSFPLYLLLNDSHVEREKSFLAPFVQ